MSLEAFFEGGFNGANLEICLWSKIFKALKERMGFGLGEERSSSCCVHE